MCNAQGNSEEFCSVFTLSEAAITIVCSKKGGGKGIFCYTGVSARSSCSSRTSAWWHLHEATEKPCFSW
ncbi:hypothetical protein AMECASPLE_013973 [Ameca splendens]|uniref:Uncharacterized protein n=1 Tax=Ameca splendens TaxID=208324 RepID=A0ABV0ZY00_9TELE